MSSVDVHPELIHFQARLPLKADPLWPQSNGLITGPRSFKSGSTGSGSAVSILDGIQQVHFMLRKRWIARDISDRRFKEAVDDLLALPVTRYPTGPLMVRAYELRSNLTAYNAAYVALAEGLEWTLVTADARLTRASTIKCQVEIFTT